MKQPPEATRTSRGETRRMDSFFVERVVVVVIGETVPEDVLHDVFNGLRSRFRSHEAVLVVLVIDFRSVVGNRGEHANVRVLEGVQPTRVDFAGDLLQHHFDE